MGIKVDIDALKQKAETFSRRMYDENTLRRAQCASEFFHREYIRMVTPPYRSELQRVEDRLVEIRDLIQPVNKTDKVRNPVRDKRT